MAALTCPFELVPRTSTATNDEFSVETTAGPVAMPLGSQHRLFMCKRVGNLGYATARKLKYLVSE